MGKVRLNLVSGAVVEKPLINAFVANNNNYVVFDNEMNGSMGLPIILVSKLENNKLTKIADQNEWQVVKEYLKNIIAGGQIKFININTEIAADDIYYTQLTLPVPSFDALKNAYKVEEANEVGVMDINLTENDNSNTMINQVNEAPINQNSSEDDKPIIDINNEVVAPSIPNASEIVNNEPLPNMEPSVINPGEIQKNYETEITPTPIIDSPIPSSPTPNNVFQEQKEAFMQACENMFDALVQKFEKELEKK